MKSVRIPAYAKVNLRLDVLGRRTDGYHDLRTVLQTISLHDTLELTAQPGSGVELHVVGNDALAGESSRDNLVYRALVALRGELTPRRGRGHGLGICAVLTKRIPAGRGLGGGSSDAAAALIGLLRLTGKTIPAAPLMAIASELGADVPFFLFGGRGLGVGRGDEVYPLSDLPRRELLVVSPREIAVPTRDAYRWVASALTKRRHATKLWQFCALCWSTQAGPLSNDFEGAVFPRHPCLAMIKRELLRQGAADASLAGSGSAVFGFFQNPASARRAAQAFPNDEVFVCSTVSRAEYRRKLNVPVFA